MQALLPVIREMGMLNGHARQSSLEARLAMIAAAPWKNSTGKDPPPCTYYFLCHTNYSRCPIYTHEVNSSAACSAGEKSKSSDEAAAGQATSLLRFAWGYVFEAPMGTLGFIEIR